MFVRILFRLIFFSLGPMRQTPVQQRHVQLLGRSVDLTRRVSVAMNLKISEVSDIITPTLPCFGVLFGVDS